MKTGALLWEAGVGVADTLRADHPVAVAVGVGEGLEDPRGWSVDVGFIAGHGRHYPREATAKRLDSDSRGYRTPVNAGDAEPERVLITGASSGIGVATAIELGTRGARVALVARSASGLERAAEEVRAAGGNPLVSEADVTDGIGLEAAIERAASTFGGLDVAVVNA